MPGPYVNDGHYMYGNAFIQPYPAYYNSAWYHRKPPRRILSDLVVHEDGCMYEPQHMHGTGGYGDVLRSPLVNKIINIETLAFRSLRIKLYAMKEEEDTDIVLEIGKQYSITYITESGLKAANGILKIIDSAIPDECVRYIGEFNETVASAWIGMDCSGPGKSDKRKIFIASIRAIEEVPVDDPSYIPPEIDYEDMTDAQKIQSMLDHMDELNDKLDQIILKVADNDQIMDKLSEMDPTQKLAYITQQINNTYARVEQAESTIVETIPKEVPEKLDAISEKINTSTGSVINSIESVGVDVNDGRDILSGAISEVKSKVDHVSTTVTTQASKVNNIQDTVIDTYNKVSSAENNLADKIDSLKNNNP